MIEEKPNESHVQTEAAIRAFFVDKLKIASDLAQSIKLERVHRMGPTYKSPRKIVAKFTYFPDRELVRSQREHLKDSEHFLHEQFPPEIVARRRALLPKLKSVKREGKQAWIAYDTLYVDGVPVKDRPSTDRYANRRIE